MQLEVGLLGGVYKVQGCWVKMGEALFSIATRLHHQLSLLVGDWGAGIVVDSYTDLLYD